MDRLSDHLIFGAICALVLAVLVLVLWGAYMTMPEANVVSQVAIVALAALVCVGLILAVAAIHKLADVLQQAIQELEDRET